MFHRRCATGVCAGIIGLAVAVVFLLSQTVLAETLFDRSLRQVTSRAAQSAPDDFSFVMLGDSRGGDKVFTAALRRASAFKPLFILHGGDLSDNGTSKELDHALQLIERTVPGLPVFVVKGNHERDRALFEEKIGPRNFSIDIARLGFKLVAVDNSRNSLAKEELAYLRRQLSLRSPLAFVAMHAPPGTERWSWHTFSEGAPELIRLLSGEGVTMAFFSHVHQFDRDTIGTVPAIISGGGGAPLVGRELFPGEPVYHIVVVRVRKGIAMAEMVPVQP